MKKYLRTAIAAALTLAAYNVQAQVETRNAHSILDATWTESSESTAETDQQLFLSGESTIHFTIKNTSPLRGYYTSGRNSQWVTDENGSFDNTVVSYIATVEVRHKSGNSYTTKAMAYYRCYRDADGKVTFWKATTKGTSRSTEYYYYKNSTGYYTLYTTNGDENSEDSYSRTYRYKYTYNWGNAIDGGTDGTMDDVLTIEDGEDDDYIYMSIVDDDSDDSPMFVSKTMYTYNSYYDEWDSDTYVIAGNYNDHGEVILSKLSSTTLRYDIFDDKPLWTVSGENTDAVDADDDGNPVTTNVQSNRLDAKSHNSREISVYVHRSLKNNTWTTLCLPFDVAVSDIKSANGIGSDAKISEFSDVDLDKGYVNFTSISSSTTTLTAGKPYLIYYTGGDKDNFFAPNVTFNYLNQTTAKSNLTSLSNRKSTKEDEGYYYVSVLEPLTNDDATVATEQIGNGYIAYISNGTQDGGEQHVKKLKSGGTLKAFRAYLYYPASSTNGTLANGKGIINIEDGLNDPTAITKVKVDGQTVSNLIYNLQGQCVGTDAQELKAGVYIRSGKKFVVK